MNKILIIEDDINLRKYIKEYLEAYEYLVESIKDFSDVIKTVEMVNPNLILLDINLPTFDGFYFLKVIRKKMNIPVMILSARSEEGEQIRGMELGADDYITKPFSMGILLAKINAVLRRANNIAATTIQVKDIKLLCEGMELEIGPRRIPLSKNEYKLLKIFFTNYRQVVSREELLEELWDEEEFVDDNTLTVNVTRLKKLLKSEGVNLIIETKRGIGYVIQ